MTLAIRLLGAPLVEVDRTPLDVDTRKATALLAYLAVENRAVRRDTLAALFWPEAGPERARSALRRTLSTLKGGLDEGRLEIKGDAVALRADALELDVERFRTVAARAVDLDELRAAAGLHRGPFLDGFGLRDAPDFDDWQQLIGDELRRELAAVLERLVDAEATAGHGPAAIAAARRRLLLDPLHEPAHRRLIELYQEQGDRSAALAQYRECVRVLHRELGVAPLEETTALYRAVREGTRVVAPASEPEMPLSRPSLPLVGRGADLDALLGAYRQVGPDGRLVVIEGEAGIGKTRLADELAARMRSAGAPAVSVRSFEDEAGLTYGTVIELLRAVVVEGAERVPASALEEAARLLPELGPAAAEPLDTPGARARFFDGIVTALVAATRAERLPAVILDDLHWADPATLDVLAYLVRRLRGRPLLLVVTWRPEAMPADHPARRLLSEAARDGRATVIEPKRLDGPAVAELVSAAGGPPELGARLLAETQGLPFFVVEYLEALPDSAEVWPVPAGIRDLLEARLAGSSEIAAQVAAAASVIGRAFEPDVVRDVSGRTDEETVAALDELVGRGVLVDVDAARYDFRHEQARRVAYESAGVGRRRLLHRRAAEALAGGARGAAAAGAVAQHFRLAGRDTDAAEWSRRAADHARSLFANDEALSFYRDALALGHPDAVALQTAIGDLQTLAGDYGAALASYETAAANALDGDVAGIEHRIGLVHHRRGEWELAEASLAVAATSLPIDAVAEQARVAADRALNTHRRGLAGEALAFAEDALRLAAAADDRRALAQAHNLLGILAADAGRPLEAREQLEQSLALAGSDEGARAAALNNLALLRRTDGDLEGALALTDEALALAARVGDRHRQAALLNNAADLLQAAGRREEAMSTLKEAVTLFAEIGEEGAMEPEIWKLREW